MYTVYILKSAIKEYFYIGVTQDLNQRIAQHNKGLSKATKPYAPFEIIHTEIFIDKKEAYKREFFLKSPKGYKDKLAILRGLRIPLSGP